MLFGQGFNDLFVIRVAGNVLGDVCMGSIEFALNALSESVKCVVMLGHCGCGAVTGAVDCLPAAAQVLVEAMPPMLRSDHPADLRRRSRGATTASRKSWGADARDMPGFREALIEVAVCLNAAHAAFDLRQEVERAAKWEIEVLYGVFSLHNHQVSMPIDPSAPVGEEHVNLAYAPTNPKDFHTLALRTAELLKPESLRSSADRKGANATHRSAAPQEPSESDDLLGIETPFRPL